MADSRKNAENYLKKGRYVYNVPVVTFGSYIGAGGNDIPIEWIVLSVSSGHYLLMSKDLVAKKPFDTARTLNKYWKDSSLRKWLNGDFLKEAFDPEERSMIDEVETERGCEDKVFLLSKEEADDLGIPEKEKARSFRSDFWLRTTAGSSQSVFYVDSAGFISWGYKDDPRIGVRPVMWVNLN